MDYCLRHHLALIPEAPSTKPGGTMTPASWHWVAPATVVLAFTIAEEWHCAGQLTLRPVRCPQCDKETP